MKGVFVLDVLKIEGRSSKSVEVCFVGQRARVMEGIEDLSLNGVFGSVFQGIGRDRMLQCESVFGFVIDNTQGCCVIDDDPVSVRQMPNIGHGNDCAEAGVEREYFIDLWFWHVSFSPSSV